MAFISIAVGALAVFGAVQADGGHNRPKPLPAETERTPDKAKFFQEFDAQRVTIKYGAVTVPPMTEHDGMGEFYQQKTSLPCQDCFITWLQMGIEHAEDGRRADADTGMWLHHGVMVNVNQTDAVCGDPGQRFAASGNERTPIDISAGGSFEGGYYIAAGDEITFVVDLMNMHETEAQDDIVVSITYEYVTRANAPGFFPITAYWLDVGGCEDSSQPAHPDSTFIYTSPTLLGTQRGTITFVGGHLHDGGTNINLMKNGKVVCSAGATYEAYKNVEGIGSTEHIVNIGTCPMPGKTKPGDSWLIKAYYDTSLHEPMTLMDGSLEPVMGIMLAYVANEAVLPPMPRPRYWGLVAGVAVLVTLVISVAAWMFFRSRRGISLDQVRKIRGFWSKDSPRMREEEEDADVPLMGA